MRNKSSALRTIILASILATALTAFAAQNGSSTISEQSNGQKVSTTNQANQATSATANLPIFIRNGQPGAMHKRLDVLVGEWNVKKLLFIAGGTPEKPIVSSGMICRRYWISETGNRHMRDVTQGTLGGNPYYRLGILSYSTVDKNYEWNTVDATNSMMMNYKGVKNSGKARGDIVMSGEFTDQGIFGSASVGKTIGQRTVIKIESSDRNVIELYFTPPGKKERLADRSIYTRRK